MVTASEAIIDRRQLRRKLTFWRIVTFLVLAGLILALVKASGAGDYFSQKSSDHIAKVKITGVITNDQPLLDLLGDLKDEDQVKAVILHISSPGGSTVGGEAIYEAVRELAKKKPVTTSVGTLAASAGYMIAAASDHIVARRSSIVGSIGVIFQYADASVLLDKLGVGVKEIKSSPLKAEPSPFHPTSEEARQMINRVVRDSYDWFVDLVAERRNFERSQALRLADGSIYSGSQALSNKLIDAIGDQDTAKNWLTNEKGIDKTLKVIRWKPKRDNEGLFSNPAASSWLLRQLGFNAPADAAKSISKRILNRVFLDGLVSMWLNPSALSDLEGMAR